jgi:rifampin ADP-ribosyltransferase
MQRRMTQAGGKPPEGRRQRPANYGAARMSVFVNDNPNLFYHGTRADLKVGDLLIPGFTSNFGPHANASWICFTAALDAAIWGAELAGGKGRERIYVVEPEGKAFDDPNLTDKKYPGNPTRSYRSQSALRSTGKIAKWQNHSPERLQEMKDNLRRLKEQGAEAIDGPLTQSSAVKTIFVGGSFQMG